MERRPAVEIDQKRLQSTDGAMDPQLVKQPPRLHPVREQQKQDKDLQTGSSPRISNQPYPISGTYRRHQGRTRGRSTAYSPMMLLFMLKAETSKLPARNCSEHLTMSMNGASNQNSPSQKRNVNAVFFSTTTKESKHVLDLYIGGKRVKQT